MKLIELGLVRPRRSPPRGARSAREPSGVRMLRASDRGSHRPRALLSGAEKAKGGKRRPAGARDPLPPHPSPQPPASTRPRLPAGWAEPKRAWLDVGSQRRGWGQDPASVRPGGPPRPARHTRRCRGRPGSSQLPAPVRAGLRGRGRWVGASLLAGPADAEPAVLPPTAGGWGAPGGDVTAADAVRRPPPGPSPTRRRADRCAPSPTDVQGRCPHRGSRGGGPRLTSLPSPHAAPRPRVRPRRAPALPSSAATFRGARPAGPPRAPVTRWGVSAAVTAAWTPARASRASRAASAPHPQACGETRRNRM